MQESTIEITARNCLCPITCQVMDDPIVAADGHTYERKAIKVWLKRNITSPLTNLPMSTNTLLPNFALKSLITEYKEQKKKQRLEALKTSKKCFVLYSDILPTQKKNFEKPFKECMTRRKLVIESIEDDWDNKDDIQKYELLIEMGLESVSYLFCTLDFRGYLSAETQQQRHRLKDASGKYPSTEGFWRLRTSQRSTWIEGFLKSAY